MINKKDYSIKEEELNNISGGIGGSGVGSDEDSRHKKYFKTMECPTCGQPVYINATKCPHCGNAIPAGIREEELADNKWRIY